MPSVFNNEAFLRTITSGLCPVKFRKSVLCVLLCLQSPRKNYKKKPKQINQIDHLHFLYLTL
jgi:hypothetical protein